MISGVIQLSDSFAGAHTKSLEQLERDIEARSEKHLSQVKTGTVVKIKPHYSGSGPSEYILDTGDHWFGNPGTYKVGDKVQVIPYMGAVKIQKLSKQYEAFKQTDKGQDTSKTSNNYQDKHTDSSSKDSTSSLPIHAKTDLGSIVSDPQQKAMDELDKEIQAYEAQTKNETEAFPGAATLDRLAGNVDESLWKKAKDASQQAFGKIKWPFVNWWYQHHGGK